MSYSLINGTIHYELDLKNYEYTEEYIIENLSKLDLTDIFKYQKTLTFNFVINYLLNEKYQITSNEKDIVIDDILRYHPYLKKDYREYQNSNNVNTKN